MRITPLPTATISDAAVAHALNTVVAVINPALDMVWGTDPLNVKQYPQAAGTGRLADLRDTLARLLNTAEVPGTSAWDQMDVDQRDEWWVQRVGALNTVLVAFPGLLGVVADRLPLQDALGFLNQAVVVTAVAREHGIHDRQEQARLLSAVLCSRAVPDAPPQSIDVSVGDPAKSAPARLIETVWHAAGLARAVVDELAKRPQPARVFQLLGMLPVVGAVADYVGEYRALERATKAGERWLAAHQSSASGSPLETV